MQTMKTTLILAVLIASALPAVADARSPSFGDKMPNGACRPEVGFSPDRGKGSDTAAVDLVNGVIGLATNTVRLAAYSFTSREVANKLVSVKGRGVDVQVIVDEKSNLQEDRSGRARAALDLLVNAGIPVRTISVYPIHHDKYMVVDGLHVETGSFNYTDSAIRRNSENALVLWDCPVVAKAYLTHWSDRWAQAVPYQSQRN